MVSALIPELARRTFAPNFYAPSPWRSVVWDLSDETRMGGDSIRIPFWPSDQSTTAVTESTELGTTASNLTWGAPTISAPSNVLLELDETRQVNKLISTLQDVRTFPEMIPADMQEQAQAAISYIETYIRGLAQARAAASVRTKADVTVTANNFANAQTAFLSNLKEQFHDAAIVLDQANAPKEGRVCITSSRIVEYLKIHMESLGIPMDGSGFNYENTVNGRLPMINGFALMADPRAGDGVANTNDAIHSMFFTVRGGALAFAQQIDRFFTMESETYRGTLVRGLISFGAVLYRPSFLAARRISIT